MWNVGTDVKTCTETCVRVSNVRYVCLNLLKRLKPLRSTFVTVTKINIKMAECGVKIYIFIISTVLNPVEILL